MRAPFKIALCLAGLTSITLTGGLVWLTWPLDMRNHRFATFHSPDGNLEVALLRRRANPWPSTEGFDVIAEVRDRSGKLIAAQQIYEVDIWSDAPVLYREVRFQAEGIEIGPEHASESGFYRLELQDQKNSEQAHRPNPYKLALGLLKHPDRQLSGAGHAGRSAKNI